MTQEEPPRSDSPPDQATTPLSLARALAALHGPEVDDPFDSLLRLVGEGLSVSRAYLFQFRDGGRRMENTHEWCAPGVEPQIQGLSDLATADFSWWVEQLRSEGGIVLDDLGKLPPEAEMERETLAAQGIRAVMALPLASREGELLGFMGFDKTSDPGRWTDGEHRTLELICQVGARELERIRSARALTEARNRLVRTEEIARVGGWEFEPDRATTWWSDQALSLLDLPPGPGSRTLFDFFQRIHPDDRERARRSFLSVVEGDGRFRCECRVIRSDGRTRHLEIQGEKQDRGPKPPLVVGTVQDLTERRGLEEQLRQAQRMDAVGKLAGGVAHDFNDLLSVILGSAEFILETGGEESPFREDLIQIQNAAERAAGLTRQLLAFSRRQFLEPRRLVPNAVLAELEGLLRRLLPEDIRMVVELSDGSEVGEVHADPSQLEEVIVNLVVNARDAMAAEGGHLRIATRGETLEVETEITPGQRIGPGRYVVIDVVDDGMGMAEEMIPRIFEPFFSTKFRGEGTGLGLSSAYGIVQQSQGGIRVESSPGAGARFSVYLPALPPHRVEHRPLPPADADALSGRTVLLVEDDPEVARMVRRILERAGVVVLASTDPQEALALGTGAGVEVDLLITDVVMPGTDGRQVARRLMEHIPELKVLFISGHPEPFVSRKGVLESADHLLMKPFKADDLLDKVAEVLSLSPSPTRT
ncbi:MAG: ATP-binding protein [Gemmatimonadota bacterium]